MKVISLASMIMSVAVMADAVIAATTIIGLPCADAGEYFAVQRVLDMSLTPYAFGCSQTPMSVERCQIITMARSSYLSVDQTTRSPAIKIAHVAVEKTSRSAHVPTVACRLSMLVCEMRLRGKGNNFVEAGVTHYI
ncbi:hypothetical protein AZE42_05971 [Rhizopogon vesiculosus]|uniref:Uncharacterized protein n=1 Tax=Rhizopogon vesiculosus TaxID=180088 RepID=A0A1J8QC79_9AGAM|nr:hypothetical protein AZE42_05971 [Rhizopogon vesiculosus]